MVEKPIQHKCYANVIVLTCDPSALKWSRARFRCSPRILPSSL